MTEDKDQKKMLKKRKTRTAARQFPVIGIGASAGGLEAFGTVFSKMPEDAGVADMVLPAERMAEKPVEYVRGAYGRPAERRRQAHTSFQDYRVEHEFPKIGKRKIMLNPRAASSTTTRRKSCSPWKISQGMSTGE